MKSTENTKICVRYQETKERSHAVEKKVPLHGLKLMNANVHRTKQTWQRHTDMLMSAELFLSKNVSVHRFQLSDSYSMFSWLEHCLQLS